jgi:hypothetical protein
MSHLREIAELLARHTTYPTPFANHRTRSEILAAKLQSRPIVPRGTLEPWGEFLIRIGVPVEPRDDV